MTYKEFIKKIIENYEEGINQKIEDFNEYRYFLNTKYLSNGVCLNALYIDSLESTEYSENLEFKKFINQNKDYFVYWFKCPFQYDTILEMKNCLQQRLNILQNYYNTL